MNIITFNSTTNYFTNITFSLLKLNYHNFNDLDDLQNNLDKITTESVIIIYKDFGLTHNFIKNLKTIMNLKENCILTSVNIYNKQKQKIIKPIIDYKINQNNDNHLKKHILSFSIRKTDLKKLLENKEIKTFMDLGNNTKFNKICLEDCTTHIRVIKNVINDNKNLFCSNFKNKKNLEDIQNIEPAYFSFIKNAKKNDKYHYQITKIYNEVQKYSLSYSLIPDNLKDYDLIIKKYVESELNTKYNILILNKKQTIKNLKSKILVIDTHYKNIFSELELNYDVYFFNSLEKINSISSNKKNQLYFDEKTKKFEILKINSIYLKFFIMEFNLENLAHIFLKYFPHNIYLINENIQLDYQVQNKTMFIPNIKLIDYLYETKFYDESCLLINFIIKNRFSFNYTFIYKTLVLVDKVNYVIGENEIKSLVSLLDFKTFDELFNIVIVLLHHNYVNLAKQKFKKFISENNILEEEIMKTLLVCNKIGLFKNEINLVEDNFIIKHLQQHFSFIKENIQSISAFKENINTEEFFIEILIYLNNRFELMKNEDFKNEINELIIIKTLDFNNLDLYTEQEIIDKLFKYPQIIINGCYILSDVMMNKQDIIKKRDNLLILTNIIIKNFDNLQEKFLSLVKKDIIISLTNLFRYAYQGIPNKNLFNNCIKISRKFLELKYRLDINNLDGEMVKDETKNLFYFEQKKTNPKKVCFISDFLTRTHSVFKDRHQVIVNLIKKGFEVYLATFKPLDFKFSETYYGIKENIVLGNMNTFNIVQKLRSYNFDKLVFCEIGMDNRVTSIAHFRMANKQYNTWGHSDTSGYENIDYFVSSELYELPYEESKEHYTEKLILQKGLCTCYVNPTSKYILNLSRSYYGLSNYEKIICCPQSLFKIHPDFDEYIFEILHKNKNVSIIFLDNLDKKYKMYERWNNILKDKPEYYGILSRVKFIPGQGHQQFCNLMKLSDILIDPYPFGGCNSSLESFSLYKPLVTQPSIRINGRFTYGFYKKMEMEDMIAYNKEQYVNITTRLLNDKDFYDKQVNLLKERSDKLFMDQQTLDEWEELMSS